MMRGLAALVLATMLVATRADAHHSYAAYLEEQPVTIEGTIETVRFANPHVLFTMRTDASDVYTVEWQNLVQLRHGKVGPTTLNAGDRIVVIASPSRDPEAHRLSLVREIRRPADGWRWLRTTRQ